MTPRTRNLVALGGVLAVLVTVFLVSRTAERRRLSSSNIREFFWADSARIDSIAIKYGTWTHLRRQGGKWMMIVDSALTYPAASADVATLLRTTNEMVLTDVISVNPAKQEKFGVDTAQGTVIRLFGGGQPLARFMLGRIGQDFTHTYVCREGSDSVFLASGSFTAIYSKSPMQWMDRQVFSIDPGRLREIRWRHEHEETRLTRSPDGGFSISRAPDFTPVPADSAEAAFKFSYVSTLTFNSFLPAGREHEANFASPLLTLSAVEDAGSVHELIIAADTSSPNRFHAIRPASPRPVGVFFKSHYDRLNGEYDALRATKE